jgi:hypothetical protein
MARNGHQHGQWFQSISVHFKQTVFHYGVIAEWIVEDQYWLNGNGTWSVWTNL